MGVRDPPPPTWAKNSTPGKCNQKSVDPNLGKNSTPDKCNQKSVDANGTKIVSMPIELNEF